MVILHYDTAASVHRFNPHRPASPTHVTCEDEMHVWISRGSVSPDGLCGCLCCVRPTLGHFQEGKKVECVGAEIGDRYGCPVSLKALAKATYGIYFPKPYGLINLHIYSIHKRVAFNGV